MNDSDLLSAVDSYFASHLDAAFWSGRTDQDKKAAVSMAKNQVLSELALSEIPALMTTVTIAIAEQAVFLAHNYDSLKEGKIVSAESVGDLSVSYSLLAGSGIGPFAQLFIAAAKRSCAPALVRIGRG